MCSINGQCIVDADRRIMYIDMNSPGSIPDSTAFQRSSFCKKILAGCLPNYSFMHTNREVLVWAARNDNVQHANPVGADGVAGGV